MHADRSINFSRGVQILNEEDLRDCFAMFAVVGVANKGVYEEDIEHIAKKAFMLADAMMEVRNKTPEDDDGIARIKKRKYVRKN